MPDNYPDFPSARQMLDYWLRTPSFQLRPHIQFRTKVMMCLPLADAVGGGISGPEKRIYKGVIVCNGHHWDKRYPDYAGEFTGEYIHSKDYKHPQQR